MKSRVNGGKNINEYEEQKRNGTKIQNQYSEYCILLIPYAVSHTLIYSWKDGNLMPVIYKREDRRKVDLQERRQTKGRFTREKIDERL